MSREASPDRSSRGWIIGAGVFSILETGDRRAFPAMTASSTRTNEPAIPMETMRPESGFVAFRHARYQSAASQQARSPERETQAQ
jgi:hypothetical protein